MAGITSRENGKKGGRPKAAHTIQAEKAKATLIREYIRNIKPINKALIKKAKEGDIQAIRELHDRVYGKSPQAITGPEGGAIKIEGVEITFRE